MPDFEYTRWDGTQQFTPQSADKLFDEFSQYMMDYGDFVLDNLEQWEDEHPDIVELLIQRGYVDKDEHGRFVITPKGVRRVESKALEELFQISRKDKTGKHETEFRGPGQTLHEQSKAYEYGDPVSNLNMHETLKNALYRERTIGDHFFGLEARRVEELLNHTERTGIVGIGGARYVAADQQGRCGQEN